MRRIYTILLLLLTSFFVNSCSKEEYMKSESGIKDELQGTWKLVAIPKYDTNSDGSKTEHQETWTFNDTKVSIINSNQAASSNYTVHTSLSKAEIKIENVQPEFTYPARIRLNNGTWQIISLDDKFLIIANDQDGSTGLTELEFQKLK
jgi:hypothetical protein